MARSNKEAGAYMTKRLLTSQAYAELRGKAYLALAHFYLKRQMKKQGSTWIVVNNGEIVFTYNEAEKLGLSRDQFKRCLNELIDKGFIDRAYIGGGLHGDTSKYAISDRWEKYGTDDFKSAEAIKGRSNPAFKTMHIKKAIMKKTGKKTLRRKKF